MKRSDKAALGMGGLTVGLGLAAAILCPIGGLIAGAYFTYGAVAATMGTGATVALTAAGGVGGLVLGRIAAPIVAVGSLAVGTMVGGVTKAFGSLFDKKSTTGARPSSPARRLDRELSGRKLDTSFDLSAAFKQPRTGGNDNTATKPQAKRRKGFDL